MKSRICSVLATLLMLALLACALLLTVPKLFGYQIYSVLTPSMTPALPVGCAVYVKACDPAALQAGDIVTYSKGTGSDLSETHRVVSNDVDSGKLTTKGDANAGEDIYPVLYSQVLGVVTFSVPCLGAAAMALQSPGGIAVCIVIFALAFLLWTLADKFKKRESFK